MVMTSFPTSIPRRTFLALAAAALGAGFTTRAGVVTQAPAGFKLQPMRVQAKFAPLKTMVTVNGPVGSIARVEPKHTAEAERLTREFAAKLASDFATRFGDDAQTAGLPLLRGDAPELGHTLAFSVPLATVSYLLPGANHYRGARPSVFFSVTVRLTDASGREVWSYNGGTMPGPENSDRTGYDQLKYAFLRALRTSGLLPY